ncbi:1-deoxy-D-xylulose-5-phosphate synthase [Moheibacter sediminis]|uniref:1-deoxy-D-xylulose-5-phosphate synthase n=1 Tax=Moheibacter sediminis TaxID=1434700 RepID=A0A1W1YE85_9FLAO|nr:1-deoxy-D-xylulose-5-phosphate synthase [Moheibacter sediminis]SMC34462.1 1-deoxy-D-xylulose-5-phosphate synthase [Moheibacter sediminis]
MEKILDNINSPEGLRKLNQNQLPQLAHEIREFILDTLSVKAGHLGASLGVVELTIALHHFYNTPQDLLIWDVGHQCYPHKILTGRKNNFDSLRQKDGISGFPAREENEFDTFGTGHSSTSISAITGMAFANQIQHKTNKHIAVIGDASIVSGMALEGLNHLGSTDLDVLIILNDNSIGIDPSVGALKEHFFQLENGLNHSVFEDFGMHYKGVIDGHNFDELFNAFDELNEISGPKLLHIKTIKGKGYAQAEADQVKWHAPGRFNKATGEISSVINSKISYQHIFGETISEFMRQNENIVAITPAMLSGSNLIQTKIEFPDRVIDVGIAEQHAVTFAAGLASQGIVTYLAIYSTFLQRAYDQVIHDVSLQNLPVVFCIDRAGIVGTDGATHHGFFDISFLRSIPNMIVAAPMDEMDFQNLLYTAQFTEQPFSIRFPKGNSNAEVLSNEFEKIEIGKAIEIQKGTEIAILTFGTIGQRIQNILNEINSKEKFGHYKFIFCKPLDFNLLGEILNQYETIITFEDGILNGGFGDSILEYAQEKDFKGKIIRRGYPDEFIGHASIEELEKEIGLDEEAILKFLIKLI